MSSDAIQTQLANGLTVLLKEIHTAPIISHWLWYRIGARNETAGKTGISHWVEHMQFKGTPSFPSGVLDKAISRTGGYWNAFTHLDWTTYFETLPADKIDLALRLESDRMCNSIYKEEEVDSERTVIISEREGSQNEPLFLLGEAVQKASFNRHPYRNEVIGEIKDLKKIKRDDLYNHYRRYYVPSNAVLTLAGDFNTQEMLRQVEEIYGPIPAGKVKHRRVKPEPFPEAEHRVTVYGPGSTTFIQLAYHAPSANQEDFFAFTILDSLLCGPTSLNMFGGGGISNKTSRLYRALVEKEIAVSVRGGLQATIDPFLYELILTVRPDRTPEEALSILDDQIQRLQDTPVSADEIARAAKQARALFAYGSENITNQAFWLGFAEMFDRYAWFTGYVDRLAQVTPEEVHRIARTYLVPARRVVGFLIPEKKGAQGA